MELNYLFNYCEMDNRPESDECTKPHRKQACIAYVRLSAINKQVSIYLSIYLGDAIMRKRELYYSLGR